jgi:prefoldin subunit 5
VIGGEFDAALTRTLMREELQARLDILKREDRAGQARLRELDQQLATLRETLLRISGAIQVLEELLGEENPAETANGTARSAGAATDA